MRIKNYFQSLFISIVFVSSSMYGQVVRQAESNSMIRFTENKNQWDSRVLYKAQLDGGALFLEKNCFTYNFYDKEALIEEHSNSRGASKSISSHAFRMTFLNSLSTTKVESINPTSDYCNYFIGNDESKWAGDVKNYRNLKYVNLYSHINLEIEGLQNSIKYNFIVEPLGNAADIQMSFDGLDNISLQKGALRLKTRINELTEHSPFAYQWIGSRRVEVPCEFVLEDNTVHFNFPNGYNKGFELVIDPEVVFSASSGSIADNFGHTCTYDAEGNLYSGGIAFDVDYPVKMAYDPDFNFGWTDVVLTKYNSKGTDLVYSTYLGGDSDEIVTSMIVDAGNNLVLYGVTGSANFPTTASAYSKKAQLGSYYHPHVNNGNQYQKGTDLYICKFSAAGNNLLASTFIGGSKNDGVNYNDVNLCYITSPAGRVEVNCANYNSNDSSKIYCYTPKLDSLQYNYGDYYRGEIDLDKFGNVYIATSTRSADFPIVNGFEGKLKGVQDGVVFKMNSDLSKLEWSTFLGGSNKDAAYSLILDDSANVYVTGGTASDDFPTTNGVVQKNPSKGKADGFIAKIKYDGTKMMACSYWGTDKYDQSYFVQLDKKNNVYLFGQTDGKMPVDHKDSVYSNPNSGQFVTKMNNQLTDVLFSTVVGNGDSIAPTISPTAFLVDVCGNIYIAGWASRYNRYKVADVPTLKMPVTNTLGLDETTNGFDFYLMVLSANADSLLYGTYWGGNKSKEHVHGGTSRFDKKGIVYQSLCTGCGYNDDYPVTPGAWPHADLDTTLINGSNCNNAVFKIDFKLNIATANFTVDNTKGCAPFTVKFKNQSTSSKILWDFGNGDKTSDPNPVRLFDNPGTYLVKLYVNDSASCNIWDSVYQYITVYEGISTDFDFEAAPCSNEIKFKDQSVKTPVSWQWDFGDNTTSTLQNPVHTFKNNNTTYSVKLITKAASGCADTTTMDIDFVGYNTSVNGNNMICKGGTVQLSATGGFEYRWVPATGLDDSTISNPVATPDSTTIYKVFIKTKNALGDTCESELSTTVTVVDPSKISLNATADRDTIVKGETTVIHATIDTSFKIHWTPITSIENPNAYDTKVGPLTTTTYTVVTNDSLGCSKIDTITIYVMPNECEAEDIFVPNTFTPNGDGQNDILYARSNVVSSIYFAVYNRWGELMFETTDLKKGWDGVYKGMKADPAVFAWYVKGKCYNGREFFKKGNVTLIR